MRGTPFSSVNTDLGLSSEGFSSHTIAHRINHATADQPPPAQACTHTNTHTHANTHIQACAPANTNTNTHTHAHTHKHMHTHTRIQYMGTAVGSRNDSSLAEGPAL